MSFVVGLTYDLRDDYLALGASAEEAAEFDAPETIDAIEAAVRRMGFETDRIGGALALSAKLAAGQRWDLVFNIAEGANGRSREAQVPAMLELYGVAYTMSDPLVCAATLDKAIAKRLVFSAGLHTPPFEIVETPEDAARVSLRYPLFAKPMAEGTGKGIDGRSLIETPERLAEVCAALLARFRQSVLVEEFLPGREFTVGIIGSGRQARVLGAMEVLLKDDPRANIYGLESKKHCFEQVTYVPAREGALVDRVKDLALKSYLSLECRDTGRVDIRCDRDGEPAFIEINPLPGLHPVESDLPMIAKQEGMAYDELIARIVASALARHGIAYAG